MKNISVIFMFLLLVIIIMIVFFEGLEEPNLKHENLHSTLWTQTAVEYQMSTLQAYRLAMSNLKELAKDTNSTAALEQTNDYAELDPAVILDIDETVLDNSPFQARLIKMNVPYNDDLWSKWVAEANADSIKGSLEFIKFAKSIDCAVFYVTNRLIQDEIATFDNLKKLGFPIKDLDELLMKNEKKEWGSDKKSRRKFVAKKYRIVMLVGDDANDFMSVSSDLPRGRFSKLGINSDKWGKSWIIIPNPQYGSWERATFGFNYNLPERQKLEKKWELLHTN